AQWEHVNLSSTVFTRRLPKVAAHRSSSEAAQFRTFFLITNQEDAAGAGADARFTLLDESAETPRE
ncbi:hypothetical protein ACFSL6_25495, partial [Paenibacillus thailandensis]|uniref:hypothetical protein n=1 Tax=Paenibacillus thailandensis TaxID=393250 RepID=UPI003632B1E6